MPGKSIADLQRETTADLAASGTISTQNLVPAGTATALSAVEIETFGRDTLAIQTVGTYTGILSVQGTVNGTTWVTLSGDLLQRVTDSSINPSIPSAAQDVFLVGVSGFNKVRVTALAAVTGSVVVSLRIADGNALVALDGPTTVAYSVATAATTNGALIKAGRTRLFEATVSNPTATPIAVKFYNKATAPTVGTDVPIITLQVAANATVAFDFGAVGKLVPLGLGISATALPAATDTGVAVVGVQIHATYI